MASAAQVEAFAWWLSQPREGRTALAIAEKFGLPEVTAERWRTAFGRQLAKVAGEAVETHLRQYRAEYEVIQSRTLGVLPKLVDALEVNARLIEAMTERATMEKDGFVNPKLIGETVNALKSVYSLAESASGADVAKRRASQKPPLAGAGDGGKALPDLGAFCMVAESFEVGADPDPEVDSKGTRNDSGNENLVGGPESLVK